MSTVANIPQRQNLREQVERLLPNWQSWYPSLFHAAEDLGLIRARVCSPDSLMLVSRHAAVREEAVRSFKERWGVEDEQEVPPAQHLQMVKRIQDQMRSRNNPKQPRPVRRSGK
ncbi:hypothetical protein [Povalibacter sp.]|uniref:hypothetical protein n=1 Tax=Povalibacter sp. TaxID=1962978 RepID=UPI002F41B39B